MPAEQATTLTDQHLQQARAAGRAAGRRIAVGIDKRAAEQIADAAIDAAHAPLLEEIARLRFLFDRTRERADKGNGQIAVMQRRTEEAAATVEQFRKRLEGVDAKLQAVGDAPVHTGPDGRAYVLVADIAPLLGIPVPEPGVPTGLLIAPWLLLWLSQQLVDLTDQRDAARQTVEAEQDACTCRRQRPQTIPNGGTR